MENLPLQKPTEAFPNSLCRSHSPYAHFTDGDAAAKQAKQGHQVHEQQVRIRTQVRLSLAKALAPSYRSLLRPHSFTSQVFTEHLLWNRNRPSCLGYNNGQIREEPLPSKKLHLTQYTSQCLWAYTARMWRLFPGGPCFQSTRANMSVWGWGRSLAAAYAFLKSSQQAKKVPTELENEVGVCSISFSWREKNPPILIPFWTQPHVEIRRVGL